MSENKKDPSEGDDLDAEALVRDRLLVGTPMELMRVQVAGAPHLQDTLRDEMDALIALAYSLEPKAPCADEAARCAARASQTPQRTRQGDAAKSALVIMDMQVDHLRPGSPFEVPRARGIVPALAAEVVAARALGRPVVWLCDEHQSDDPELEDWGVHNAAGTEGNAVWPALGPLASDTVVTHRAYSGFFQTKLEETLRALAVTRIELTGCLTEVHLYLTAADGLMRGFDVHIPAACQAGQSELAENVIMTVLAAMKPVRPMTTPS